MPAAPTERRVKLPPLAVTLLCNEIPLVALSENAPPAELEAALTITCPVLVRFTVPALALRSELAAVLLNVMLEPPLELRVAADTMLFVPGSVTAPSEPLAFNDDAAMKPLFCVTPLRPNMDTVPVVASTLPPRVMPPVKPKPAVRLTLPPLVPSAAVVFIAPWDVKVSPSGPPVDVMGALMLIWLPASSVSDVEPPNDLVIGLDTVMLPVAASDRLVVLSRLATPAAVIRLLTPGKSPESKPEGVMSPVLPSMAAMFPIVILAGSSSSEPVAPCGAVTSTPPVKPRCCLPETSTAPPSPPAAPPRAEMEPA